jgi:hypothetical protein
VDFVGKACYPDRDRRHANNEPKHQISRLECGGGDNPEAIMPAEIKYDVSLSMLDI